MENTVEMNQEQVEEVLDDAALSSITEEETDASEPIESVIGEEAPVETQQSTETQTSSEPGWIKKRIDKAVSKAVAEAEQRVAAQYEAQFAPIRERMLEAEAKELVRSGEFKSLDRAKEYLQLKSGKAPVSAPAAQPSRDEQGRFTQQSSEPSPAAQAQANMLVRQAEKIKANRGLDVIAEYNENEEARNKILSGEWDFYDLADDLDARQKRRKNAPTPMRSPNGVSGSERSSIAGMTKAEFERLEKNIDEGKRYSV